MMHNWTLIKLQRVQNQQTFNNRNCFGAPILRQKTGIFVYVDVVCLSAF